MNTITSEDEHVDARKARRKRLEMGDWKKKKNRGGARATDRQELAQGLRGQARSDWMRDPWRAKNDTSEKRDRQGRAERRKKRWQKKSLRCGTHGFQQNRESEAPTKKGPGPTPIPALANDNATHQRGGRTIGVGRRKKRGNKKSHTVV